MAASELSGSGVVISACNGVGVMVELTVLERAVLTSTSRWAAVAPVRLALHLRQRYDDVREHEVERAIERLEQRGWLARRMGWVHRTRLGEHVAARVTA